jgi:hypothetical protein
VKKKIYLYLCGGLGNQLFQYAAAKNIAIINDADLIIDTQCGFITDFRDFWKFSLSVSNLKNVILKKNILVFWLYRIYKKFFGIRKTFNFFLFRNLINEMFINYFDEKIKRYNFKDSLYLFGYFQSEKYFADNKNSIVNELKPPAPTKNIFLEMKDKIVNSNSISLGLRLHETMPQDISYKVGGITPFDFYKNSVSLMLKKISNPTFFIFSTKSSNVEKLLLDFVEIKKFNFHIITEDKGFEGASDNLWLMSHCANHVISNSTLYWWAVYLSSFKYKNQNIICADNFANKDTCLESWKLKNFK